MGHKPGDAFNHSSIRIESANYNDMLIGDFDDTYFNNTLKYMHSLKFARWYCFPNISIIPFTVLMDDDYILQLNNLVALINKHQPNEQLYMGLRVDSTPFRLTYRKFGVRNCSLKMSFCILDPN